MRKILLLICLISGLLSGKPAYAQISAFSVMNVNPGSSLIAGQTVQITYSLNYIMHDHTNLLLDVQFNSARFTYVAMGSNSANLFLTAVPYGSGVTINSISFNSGDNNWNASTQFTLTFMVNYEECSTIQDNINVTASTVNYLPADNQTVSSGFSLTNLNSNPYVNIEKIEGEECVSAIYKITSYGIDAPTNSNLILTVPAGITVAAVSNSAGFPVSYTGNATWQRNGNPVNTLQIFYVLLNFSSGYCTAPGPKILNVTFSTHAACNPGALVTIFSTPLPISNCCINPSVVQIIPGVFLKKSLEKTLYRYFPLPDNCKTHNYFVELTNTTANPLANFKIADALNTVLSSGNGLIITDINVELISLMGSAQTFTYNVTPAGPLNSSTSTTVSSGAGYKRIYTQSTASWPAYDGIWPSTPLFKLEGTINFPAYSKIRIKITHRLNAPNLPNLHYINIASASFSLNGTPYSGSVTLDTVKDAHAPVITITKGVRKGSTGAYTSSVNAGPGDGLEFQIRIVNIGMADIPNATLTDLVNYALPSTSGYYYAPTGITVSGTGYTSAALSSWNTALTNGFNITGTPILLPPIAAATCPGYTEIIIRYKVLVKDPAIVLCNSIYTNKVKLIWNAHIDSSQAKINIDLFQNINYKFEATCDTLPPNSWAVHTINGVPGTYMYFKASMKNTNTFQVNGLKMMVQLPNGADNISVHGPATLTSVLTPPTTAFTPLFYSLTPPFATSPTTPDGWLNSSLPVPASGAAPIALYTMGNLPANGGIMTISYRVLVPVNYPGSYYRSVLGVSMSLGAGCDSIIKTDTMTVKIATSNNCKTLTTCEQIMFDSKLEYLGANNFRISITNILDAAGFNVELMDIIVHQPYKDCPATGLFAKPRLPFALGTISFSNPPFTLVSASPVGYRYYPLANNSGSTVSFGDAIFNFTATVSATPSCQLVFPVNIRFKKKPDNCNICERTIYLRMNHVTTYILPNWHILVQDGLLKSEKDPLNVALNKDREALAQSDIGKQIEKWYTDVKSDSGIVKALENYPTEVFAMFAIGRRLIEKEGILTSADIDQIAKGMQLVDKEITPAPQGLIAEIVKRLNSSVGMKWPELMANLKK
jgi:hypothetical protein